jgi:hypothetical protein
MGGGAETAERLGLENEAVEEFGGQVPQTMEELITLSDLPPLPLAGQDVLTSLYPRTAIDVAIA